MKVEIFEDFRIARVNQWLEKNPNIEIKFTNCSEAIGKSQYGTEKSKTLYIFYEDGNENITLNS